jgi:glucokinase
MKGRIALISDLGATNARFELLRVNDSAPFQHTVLHSATYPTASASNFPELVRRFVAGAPEAPPSACACAVCGPVTDGAAYCASQVLGEPWKFNEADVSEAAGGVPTQLLNDFVAVGFALPAIPADRLHQLHAPKGPPSPTCGKEACLGPGMSTQVQELGWGMSTLCGVRAAT